MKKTLPRAANKLNKDRKQRKWWQRIVHTMAMVVVFCTTYALILPAITMEQETICGLEAHAHTEDCYAQQSAYVFDCGLETDVKVVHSHDALCYDDQGALICPLPALAEHTHEDGCYSVSGTPACGYVHVHDDACRTVESVPVCTLEETEGHTHSESCTTAMVLMCENQEADHVHDEACYEVQEAVCTLEEQEAHAHGEECYVQQEVICVLTTNDGHIHEDACYLRELTCELEEIRLHTHEEACYADDEAHPGEKKLICTLPPVIAHTHTEDCRIQHEQVENVLICGQEAHVHEDSCYPAEEESSTADGYICSSGVHAHVETCYNEAGELVCTIPEHAHDASCIVEDLDLTADVETQQIWEETMEELVLTGNWPKDILAVAETQLGYKESVKNVILEDGQLKGYTRYGDWYGIPYGDWCAMYASFCLRYAGVEEYPLESEVNRWIEALTEAEYYATSDLYTGKPGDLIFFDYDQKRDAIEEIPIDADHVGIVVEQIPATEEEPAKIKTIEGNTNDKVDYVTYELDDPAIIGYGKMPFGKVFYLTHEGPDYTVTVTVGKDALIPDSAQLAVREIEKGTEEYDTYYQQSIEALIAGTDSEEAEISFARFFDISFLVNGEVVEPAAPVDVQIRYSDSIAVKEEENGMVVHFAKDGVEILDADTYAADPDSQADDSVLTDILEIFTGETEQVDTFQFTQDSFSVVGTMLTNYSRAISATTAKIVNFNNVNTTGETLYVIYAEYNGKYYAITSKSGDVTGYSVPITVNRDGTISWTTDDNSIFWNFTKEGNAYYVQNFSTARYIHAFDNSTPNNPDYGTTTGGRNASTLTAVQDGRFTAMGNGYYTTLVNSNGQITFNRTNIANQATRFYVAEVGTFLNVWFDGTDGGMMSYYGADNVNLAAPRNTNGRPTTITLPETWKSPTKYAYKLQGWYDIYNHKYYAVDPTDDVEVTASITNDTVFYADWVAASYDVGVYDENHTVNSLDTNDFITTHVFDYNALFNVMSQSHTGSISASDHKENWTVQSFGNNVPYRNQPSLDFVFVDYDAGGEFSYANDRNTINNNQGDEITDNILSRYEQANQDLLHDNKLLDLLFKPVNSTDPDSDDFVIGRNYVGTGNYLYQYMDSTTPNYDGEHDGYYYLDARLNAASYNQQQQRFYLYDYLERTSDSRKDGHLNPVGQYSDLLPFNSPYQYGGLTSDRLDIYSAPPVKTGYEYDAKDGGNNYPEYNDLTDATTNYFFGIRSDIEFFLPNAAGSKDAYDNYGNISTRGEHMIFEFHGDDDVWVFVDGKLMLDIGGLHGIMHGRIDFSTGTISYGIDGTENGTEFEMNEGTHTMTVYYMERGSSQSNCAIYFNIAPRFDLQITKEDIYSAQTLANAEFTVYTCEGCANVCKQCQNGSCHNEKHNAHPVTSCSLHGTNLQYAELWADQAAYDADMNADGLANNPIHTMVTNAQGLAKCWGLSAGKTYYIKETEPPTVYDPAYPRQDDVIRITLNNRGTASIETTTLHGTDSEITEGYAVIEQSVDNTLKLVSLTITNQHEGDTTKVRVKKEWADGATDLPNSIIAYLMKDGVRVGREAVLNDANGWTYTWEGLPKYELDATNTPVEIQYTVGEVHVPGYTTNVSVPQNYQDHVDWIKTESMEDSATYLLVNGSGALAYNDQKGFYWIADIEMAKGPDPQDPDKAYDPNYKDANWDVTTHEYGFRLKNQSGFYLAFNRSGSRFTGTTNAAGLNQVIYYLENRLVAHDEDKYYQLYNINGASAAADGLTFELIRKDVINGTGFIIENVPITYDDQTFVEVNKVWDDTLDHSQDSVTVHLYADGEKTATSLVLNEKNNWYGIIEGLPLKNASGEEIEYTFQEDEPLGYDAQYEVNGIFRQLVTWVRADKLTANGIYRIVDGAEALGVTTTGALQVAVNNANDTMQWWTPDTQGSRIVLKSYNMNIYLKIDNGTLTTVTSPTDASTVNLSGSIMSFRSGVTDYYLQLTGSSVTVTTQANNATAFTVMQRLIQQLPGTSVTVTNSEEVGYQLPMTGGMGTSHFTFGGLLMMAAVLMYICKFGRKQQRGGKYQRS